MILAEKFLFLSFGNYLHTKSNPKIQLACVWTRILHYTRKRILAIFKNKLNFLCIYSWAWELVLIWIFSPYMYAYVCIAPHAQILNPSCKCWIWVLMGGDLEQWISGSVFGDGREGQWAVKSHIPVQWSWNNGIVLWKRGCFSLLHSSPDLQGPDCAVNQQKSVWCKAGREFKRARGDSRGILLSVRKCFSDFKMVDIWKAALVSLQRSEFVVGTSTNYIASFVGLTLYCWKKSRYLTAKRKMSFLEQRWAPISLQLIPSACYQSPESLLMTALLNV